MVRATSTDKAVVVNILAKSFQGNKSVNYIVQQDARREQRLQSLMEYSFDVCHLFGDVFLTDDKKGCALILMPDRKKTTLKSVLLDLTLTLSCIGLSNLRKVMTREAAVRKLYPTDSIYYLWFIGVDPSEQNRGVGTRLLQDVIREGFSKERPIYLETSTLKNIPWYEKFGFRVYHQLDFGYELFCMRRE